MAVCVRIISLFEGRDFYLRFARQRGKTRKPRGSGLCRFAFQHSIISLHLVNFVSHCNLLLSAKLNKLDPKCVSTGAVSARVPSILAMEFNSLGTTAKHSNFADPNVTSYSSTRRIRERRDGPRLIVRRPTRSSQWIPPSRWRNGGTFQLNTAVICGNKLKRR